MARNKHVFQLWKAISWMVLSFLFLMRGSAAQDCVTLADATHAPEFTWTPGGDTNWFAQADVVRDGGSCAAQAGPLAYGKRAYVLTVVTGRGEVAFFWKVSSKTNDDYLSFYYDGSLSNRISGEVDWEQRRYAVDVGGKTLRWDYQRFSSTPVGSNAAWMTDFTFTAYTGSMITVTGNLVFGRVTMGTSSQRVFTVYNQGYEPTTVSAVQLPAGFTAMPTNFSVDPGAKSNVLVRFEPQAAGLATGVLEVVSDAWTGQYTLAFSGRGVVAGDRFVWMESPNPTPPFTNWDTAAHTIQEAIDEATSNETIWVTNGVYNAGGAFFNGVTNRAVVNTGMVLRSVNGAASTVIEGASDPGTNVYGLGPAAVRGVVLHRDAVLDGFTIRNGRTHPTSQNQGGGIYVSDSSSRATILNCVVVSNCATTGGGLYRGMASNCVFRGNLAVQSGGGASDANLLDCLVENNQAVGSGGGLSYGSTTRVRITGNQAIERGGGVQEGMHTNSLILDNYAASGGGAYGSWQLKLFNCTVAGNRAGSSGGGVVNGSANNSLIYHNTAISNQNWQLSGNSRFYYCATTPQPELSGFGTNNITDDPQLSSLSDPHLLAGSPCIGAGSNATWMATAVDMDGEPRENAGSVDIGADQFWANGLTGTLHVAIGLPLGARTPPGYALPFLAAITGRCEMTWWNLGDGTVLTNAASFSHAYAGAGDYEVRLTASNLNGEVSAVVTVHVAVADVYVTTSGDDASDGSSWDTAKRTIQGAVDSVVAPGATVWVSNGVYETGGLWLGGVSNRVAVTNPIAVRSVNGAGLTVIRGAEEAGSTNLYGCGANAVRGVYLANGASLSGFKVELGRTGVNGQGGGVWCDTPNNVVSGCWIYANAAHGSGGGIRGGTVVECLIETNTARQYGGGASESTLHYTRVLRNKADNSGGGISGGSAFNSVISGNESVLSAGGARNAALFNCAVLGNRSFTGGGAQGGSAVNTIIYYNEAMTGPNWPASSAPAFSYCCVTPLPGSGTGNFADAPQVASFTVPHLLLSSPCVGAGITQSWMAAATDMDGEARTDGTFVDVGCDQLWPTNCVDGLTAGIFFPKGNIIPAGIPLPLAADVIGRAMSFTWDLGGGVIITNDAQVTHTWSSNGQYVVTLRATNLAGEAVATATVRVETAVQYVAPSGDDAADGTSWATARQTIQAAVNASSYAGLVLVSNGVYDTGSHPYLDMTTSNRVIIKNGVTVRSVNGPDVTIIAGQPSTNGNNGAQAVRCVLMEPATRLEGFSLTNGFTDTYYQHAVGGGVYALDASAVISNCVISDCRANSQGGGVWGGTLHHCRLLNNRGSDGGGAYGATLYDCLVSGNSVTFYNGGGLSSCRATRCEIAGNLAKEHGGGASGSFLTNCVVRGNTAPLNGGGASGSSMINCTVAGNTAVNGNGGGVLGGTQINCIIYYNSAPLGINYHNNTVVHGCTTPLPPNGSGNFSDEPLILGPNNPRLLPGSPCYNSGTNQDWMIPVTDIEGNPRIVDGIVDVGAYEWNGTSGQTGALTVVVTAQTTEILVDAEIELTAEVGGQAIGYRWDYGDGGHDVNLFSVHHAWSNAGEYTVSVVASNQTGSATGSVQISVLSGMDYYVATDGDDANSGLSWTAPKRTIQRALDAALAGATVWVSNGTYNTGGSGAAPGGYTNRVYAALPVTLRSMNGPDVTVIDGGYESRCVFLSSGASLVGFTVSNGVAAGLYGGGVYCQDNAVVINCIIRNNRAEFGGGIAGGICHNSQIQQNTAFDGWTGRGGGAYMVTLYNCLLARNSAVEMGGGAYDSDLFNCTVAKNEARRLDNNTGEGGGIYGSDLHNSIVWSNTAPSNVNWAGTCDIAYSCSTPQPVGTGNIASDPLFADFAGGDYRLQSSSPCINAGEESGWMTGATDLIGNSRVIGAAPDMGTYEYPLPITGIRAATNAAGDCVAVEWDIMPGSSYYEVFRSEGQGAPISLASTINHAYSDCSARKGVHYRYWISADYGTETSALTNSAEGWLKANRPLGWLLLLLE